MKTPARLALSIMFVCFLGACTTATPQPDEGMINPGDKIGDFLITTSTQGDVTYGWELDKCVQQDSENVNWCPAPLGSRVNISVGIYDDTFKGRLESLWSEHTYEMSIQGRPVNLQAFGFIDTTHPMAGTIRYWNVIVTTTQPGEIVVSSKGVIGGDPLDDTTTYSFNAP